MKRLSKYELMDLIDFMIRTDHRVIGTKRKGDKFVFGDIAKGDDFTSDYLPTILPVKKYFMPSKEVLFNYDKDRQTMAASEGVDDDRPRVYIGLRECDLASLRFLDDMMLTEEGDAYYRRRREKSLFFVFDCQAPLDDQCFCYMLHEKDYSMADAVIYRHGDGFAFDVRSDQAKVLMDSFAKVVQLTHAEEVEVEEKPIEAVRVAIENHEAFDDMERVEIVCTDLAEKCFSCGSCTAVCPTCYCFSINDEDAIHGRTGERIRTWDGCMLEDFSLVTGGRRLVRTGVDRAVHRFNRKYRNAYDSQGAFICVGCGRCSRMCPTGNSMKEMTLGILEVTDDGKE